MTKKRNQFTKKEDQIILNCVKESPNNIAKGLRKADSIISTHNFDSIQSRYYSILTKPNNNTKNNIVYTTINKKHTNINRKIERGGKYATKQRPTSTPASKWKRILTILFS